MRVLPGVTGACVASMRVRQRVELIARADDTSIKALVPSPWCTPFRWRAQ